MGVPPVFPSEQPTDDENQYILILLSQLLSVKVDISVKDG